MHKLLKLSNIAINVSHISRIHITNNKYIIHLSDYKVDGIIFLSSGTIDTRNSIIEINKDNHPDYFKISDYISKYGS
jgi:hypothetical protein